MSKLKPNELWCRFENGKPSIWYGGVTGRVFGIGKTKKDVESNCGSKKDIRKVRLVEVK